METTVAVFFGIIAVVTLTGNSLVVVIFLKNREWLKKVHTCLLLALAIQDILTAVCLLLLPKFVLDSDVYKLPSHPTHRLVYCRMIWSQYIPFALSIVSIYTCLMLAIDRWIAVFRPMAYSRYCSSRKVIVTMLFLPWIAGFVFELGTALNIESVKQGNESYVCVMTRKIHSSAQNAATVLFLVLGKGFLPGILMVIAYAKMVIKLRKTSAQLSRTELPGTPNSTLSNGRRLNEGHYSLKKITRMVFAATAIVMICWFPDQLYFCLSELNLIKLNDSLHNGLHILAFLNTCLNPFVYGFSNTQYQKEFKKIMCSFFPEQTRPNVNETKGLEERDQQIRNTETNI